MTSEQRAYIVQLLNQTEAAFLDLVAGWSDEQWNYKPAPDLWSVAETAEHLVLGETGLFLTMERALSKPPDPSSDSKTAHKNEFLERVLPNRAHQAQAPDRLRPHFNWTREETIARFRDARAKTLRFAQETGAPLESHTADHPFPVFGALNAYQWLLYIPLHNARHHQQIAEAKASPAFPK